MKPHILSFSKLESFEFGSFEFEISFELGTCIFKFEPKLRNVSSSRSIEVIIRINVTVV